MTPASYSAKSPHPTPMRQECVEIQPIENPNRYKPVPGQPPFVAELDTHCRYYMCQLALTIVGLRC